MSEPQHHNTKKSDVGLIGLAVMGQNLALNLCDHQYSVAVFNRSQSKTDSFIEANPDKALTPCKDVATLVASLEKPRKIILMVQAGDAVDSTINTLQPLLDEGDIIIDGGNSHFDDSSRRFKQLQTANILFIGTGISGGEEGARFGPSIMPGGSQQAWPHVKDMLQSISAKVDNTACCEWVGPEGSGHFVKMVHNGIEYGDMQLIAEAYDMLNRGFGKSNQDIHNIFTQWNKGKLNSYLIEITAEIFNKKSADGTDVIDIVLDAAGQKGTGKWTATNALTHGTPLTLITEAVFSRALSARKEERLKAQASYQLGEITANNASDLQIEHLEQALYAAKIISYAQGFMLMHDAAKEKQWNLSSGNIALMWRGGCIIRSQFLNDIYKAYETNPNLENLLLDEHFIQEIKRCEQGLRETLKSAISLGIPMPAMSSALAFLDGYRSGKLPANLIQAQRDFFGAHTYERVDKPRGEFYHTDWNDLDSTATSGTYDA